jgi:hypothetical protein
MSDLIGALDVADLDNGYWFDIAEGGPIDGIPAVRGRRVLIPGRRGLYTTADPFEDDHLLVRYHGIVWGDGATPADRRTSYATRFAALKAACDVAAREDVTLSSGGYIIAAGFLRFVGPTAVGDELREIDIEFDATDPPEWEAES